MHVENGCKWVYYWFMLRIDTLQITPEILSLIARIDEFKGAWRVRISDQRDRSFRLNVTSHFGVT